MVIKVFEWYACSDLVPFFVCLLKRNVTARGANKGLLGRPQSSCYESASEDSLGEEEPQGISSEPEENSKEEDKLPACQGLELAGDAEPSELSSSIGTDETQLVIRSSSFTHTLSLMEMKA